MTYGLGRYQYSCLLINNNVYELKQDLKTRNLIHLRKVRYWDGGKLHLLLYFYSGYFNINPTNLHSGVNLSCSLSKYPIGNLLKHR